MRVEVLGLNGGHPVTLECATPVGHLRAVWRGAEPPSIGEDLDVEIDPLGELLWGRQVRIDVRPIGMLGEALIGLVEDVDGETVTLQVSDAVVLLDVLGEPPVGIVGRRVVVHPESFDLYPTGA